MSQASFYVRHVQSPEYRASRAQKADLIYAICERFLGEARVIADLGAGTGLIKSVLEERSGRSIVGFELDREFVVEPARMVVADLTRLPVAEGSIDFAIANHVYEHLESLDVFFSAIKRLLAPGGRVYMTAVNKFALIEPHYRLPTLSWWPEPIASRMLRWSGRGEDYADTRPTTHRRLTAAAREHGLRLADITDDVLISQLQRYDSWPGRWFARAALRLPAGVRRMLLTLISPQWFFFIIHEGDDGAAVE